MEPKKKRGRPRKVIEPVVEKGDFSITLTLGDTTVSGRGISMLEALQRLPKPAKMVSKGVVVLSNGTKTRTLVYTPFQVKRLFFPIATKFIAKQFSYGMI